MGTLREDSDNGGREHVSEANIATWGNPASPVCFSIADVETMAVPQDWDANPGLPTGEAGLRSEIAFCVAEAEADTADAYLESVFTDALIDSKFWWSLRLRMLSWISDISELQISLGESPTSPFKGAILSEAIFNKAPLIALHSPSSQGSTTTSSLERAKSTMMIK